MCRTRANPLTASVGLVDVSVTEERPEAHELVQLYDSVGWTLYTGSPSRLHSAILASAHVVAARSQGRLVGLARVVGDGLTIAYLQDILVRPEHQRQGIGSALFRAAFAPYTEVRQQVLLTDATPATAAFYEAMGFVPAQATQPPCCAYVRFTG